MFTVELKVNGKVIEELSAINKGHPKNCDYRAMYSLGADAIRKYRNYKLSTGKTIQHCRSDGAIVLAIKMLETIK